MEMSNDGHMTKWLLTPTNNHSVEDSLSTGTKDFTSTEWLIQYHALTKSGMHHLSYCSLLLNLSVELLIGLCIFVLHPGKFYDSLQKVEFYDSIVFFHSCVKRGWCISSPYAQKVLFH